MNCRPWLTLLVVAVQTLSPPVFAQSNIQPQPSTDLVPDVPKETTSLTDVLINNPIKLSVSETAIGSAGLASVGGSLTVKQAVEAGLANNLVYKQSLYMSDINKFKARAALGRFGPNISFNTYYAASSLNQMLFYPFNDGTAAAAPMQPINRGQLFSAIFAGTQPLFTGGYLTGNLKVARAQAHQSLEGYRSERIAAALRIKQAYWTAVWLENKLKVSSDYVKFREQSSLNMRAKEESGKVARADYLREVNELAQAKEQVNQDYKEFNQALIKLKFEMGVNLTSLIGLADDLVYSSPAVDLNVFLTKAAIARPEIAQAAAKVEEARGRRMMVRSAYSPHVNLYGLTSNVTGDSPDGRANGKWGGVISVIGHLTLFDSGQRFNELRAANAEVRQADYVRRQAELQVAQDISNAWIEVDTARRSVELVTSGVASAAEDYRLLHARYLVGKAIPLEEFDAAIRLFRARLKVLEAVYNLRLAQDRLVWASGDI